MISAQASSLPVSKVLNCPSYGAALTMQKRVVTVEPLNADTFGTRLKCPDY